ncbi:hypothetical protein HK407_09g15280 [Ordospora pajunii]|jgi:hypothetical protein|uniref:uncharacterized protein n=1 Tax=Ordospora pajunii TaxID=3039483 RepID=UPI0029527FEF|nr:uncharacterized protein HK407_09g15280 [Ordospora pajunii]KAH9410933.1 hypothetical protein HK407_09g15280 [Ordospora pajunii]
MTDKFELKARIRLRLLAIDNALIECVGRDKVDEIRRSVRISLNAQSTKNSRIVKPRASTKDMM